MKRLLGFVFLLLMTAGVSFAQAGFGTLAGTITDSSGAVVPHATVTLTSPDGIVRTTKTSTAGDYQFTALPVVGGYTLTVTVSGFETAKVSGLATSVGTVINQNITLQPGSENQTVTVTAAAVEQVQTDTSSVSQLVDSTIWKDSPLETRTQNQFIFLTAGAATDQGTGRGAAVSGARSGTGNFLVEGMDNNDQGQGGAGTTVGGGGAVTTISPDAIQEYRVISHNPSAEYGRAGGFSTDTSLKSGTNKWHGSLFEYNRVQALAAEHYFSNLAGVKDSLVRNQFGGSVGGPIHKDTTYFFATVEIHHLRTGAPTTGTVVTPDFLNFVDSGAFETFQESNPGGVCMVYTGAACPGGFNRAAHLGPVFKQLLAAEPQAFPTGTQQPQNAAQGLYTGGNVTYPVPEFAQVTRIQSQPLDQERASFKLDQKLSEKDQLSFTYLIDLENTTVAFGGGGTTFGPDESQVGGSQLFTGNWTHTFSPTLQNVFRLGYTRHVSNFADPNTAGVPMTVTAADPLAAGFGASSAIPQLFTDNEFLYEDALTKNVGNHTLKTGFRFIRTRNGSSFYNDVSGTLEPWDTESLLTDETFDDQADAALGNPFGGPEGSLAIASASIDTTTNQVPDVYRGFRANEFAAYFQDDWRVSSKLTLNLGLRWEYFGPPHNFEPGFDSNVYFGAFGSPTPNGNPFLPNTPLTGAIQSATFIQKNSNIWNKDTNNFGPRFGFAYDPTGKGKFAIRGGFGIGFDRLYNNVYENIRFNAPRFSDNSIGAGVSNVVAGALEQPDLLNLPFNANSLFAAYGGKPVPRHIDQRLVTAYYEQANFGVEYEVAKGYVAEVNYIGTFGRKLVGLEDVNTFDGRTACPSLTPACVAAGFTAPTTARPNLIFNGDNFRTNGFSSNYNGLQASIRKSFSNGLMFLGNYTYSKSMDVISDVFTVKGGQTGISDPGNPSYDYSPADFDVRNLASITLNYESQWKKNNLLLGGWGISPIISMASGSPFSVYDASGSYNPLKNGLTSSSANRVPYVGKGNQKNAVHRNVNPAKGGYINASDFQPYTCPANIHDGLWCSAPAGRNAFYGPKNYNVDLGVSKRFHIMESQQFTFQASFFNLFNHANFANPVSDLNSGSIFGASQSTADPRVTQLSLRYDF